MLGWYQGKGEDMKVEEVGGLRGDKVREERGRYHGSKGEYR